ncbi:hypothetical protein [Streptomyces botrytidirepellens]|uniref:Uncharacterized protein n=1 Tax=Streptomyces botrytidirepellens TaxID=2486417 RepID=A0A3M8U6L4_9ACTN|nr:hypothetical protein [Streptomyces botrytidirepellens]RNF99180.1 hypothetical protein EEJ42_35955 [Streptomyces botrytidirepellens]
MNTTNPSQDETAAVTALLLTRHPSATFDTTGAVATAGLLCSPGTPDSAQTRVCHRAPFPSVFNGRPFADVEAEEHVLAATYADLLREAVTERPSGCPGLLVSKNTIVAGELLHG